MNNNIVRDVINVTSLYDIYYNIVTEKQYE